MTHQPINAKFVTPMATSNASRVRDGDESAVACSNYYTTVLPLLFAALTLFRSPVSLLWILVCLAFDKKMISR